ncbi:MAG: bifunctional folylpolyglutamate synthase/dihydrofolate synthase [Anaerolineae bacterium]|nr:bifunctional folylpolyglutamate synthase/dihydrofolate synthase [Anaerolineae bacterium]
MNYRDALSYIYHFTDYEKRGFAAYAPEFYSLDRVRRLLALLGDPQDAFQAIHIAGTKGKGSTAALAESMLRAAGYRTGLYTSPHLHSYRERIQVGGELISEGDVARLIHELRPVAEQIPDITTFEVMTAMAFGWFAEQAVDWAVLEVGLGGRLDATNVISPALAVITSISLDHMLILGDTIHQIAQEKAGIIKEGVPVVSAPQPDEALAVIEAVCQERAAPLTLVGRDWTWQAGRSDLDGQHFAIMSQSEVLDDLWMPLLGRHQLVNATTAVAALRALPGQAGTLPPSAIRAGLHDVVWPGRLEILNRSPLVVVDSAHNGDSAEKLMAALEEHLDFQRLILVLGASPDHATPEMLTALLAEASAGTATQSHHPRAAEPTWLRERAAELGFHLDCSESVSEALEWALAGAGPDDLVLCTGSVFVAAEARLAWFEREGIELPPLDPA